MDEKLIKVKPCGILHAGLESYYLIKPEPIAKYVWNCPGCYRFLVVPQMSEAIEEKGEEVYEVYGYMRHLVTTSFSIEYRHDIEEITIPILDEIDLSKMEIDYAEKDTEEFPF